LKDLHLVAQGQHFQLQDGARARATSQGQQKREKNGHEGFGERMPWSLQNQPCQQVPTFQ
jgi:hypothetical protein